MRKVIPTDAVLVPDNAELKFQGKIFDVYQWPQTMFDGSEQVFEMLKRTDTVNALCIVNDKLLVLDEDQPHLGPRQSLPGGRIDPQDSSVQAAAEREILEETGYQFKNWRLVKGVQPYRKIEWFVYTLLAWEVINQHTPHLDPGEKITMQVLDFAEVKQLIMDSTGYLGESRDLFKNLDSIDDLLVLPELTGQGVDR